jgi:CubicO group peptidase (beta-lactamase class C family)
MSTPLTPDLVRDAVLYVDDWLAFRTRHGRVPGVQAAVWCDGELVLSTAHGVADEADGTPLTPDHAFRVASHSKTFTATLIAMLVDDGALRFDDTLGEHLPWLVEDGSALAERTIAQVLAHAGGITRDTRDAGWWWLDGPFPDAATLRRIASDEPPVTDADVSMKYSNVGFALLGEVVEAAGGLPWGDAVVQRIVEPLGLERTGPDWTPDLDVPFATAHSGLVWTDHRVPIDQVGTGAYAAATGVWSTASDLCRYLAGHLPEGGLLPEGMRRRLQRQVHDVPGVPGGYALGFMTGEVAGRGVVGHGGGWPGHISRSLLLPAEGIVVSVCTNAADGPAAALAEGMVKLFDLAATRSADRAVHDRAPVSNAAEAVTGRWVGLWGAVDLVALGGDLLVLDPTQPDPTAVVTVLEEEGEDRFAITSTQGYASPGEHVTPERDDHGDVVALRVGGMRVEPIDTATLPARIVAR